MYRSNSSKLKRGKLLRPKGKLLRSEIVTVRLDPRLRYMASLAARKQRRTLSSYIEWAVEKSLDPAYDALELWDIDESIRLKILKDKHPELLTYDELIFLKREDTWKK